jgi:tight adherence protein B
MPPWFIVVTISVAFTAVFALGQGVYWAWVAKLERRDSELMRRLGTTHEASKFDELFQQFTEDRAAKTLGFLGTHIEKAIRLADSNRTVGDILIQMAIVGFVCLTLFGVILGKVGLILAIPSIYLPVLYVRQQGQRRFKILIEQLPDALELMSRSLQAGLALNDAMRLVAEEMPLPVAAEFGRVYEEVRFGREYRDAFAKMLHRNPEIFELRLLVSSVLLQRETGGNLIEILSNIADTVRSRFVFAAKVRAMTSEAKFSAVILGGLPLAVSGMILIINPEYLAPLFTDPVGNLLLAYTMVSYTVGIFLMRDMSNVEI